MTIQFFLLELLIERFVISRKLSLWNLLGYIFSSMRGVFVPLWLEWYQSSPSKQLFPGLGVTQPLSVRAGSCVATPWWERENLYQSVCPAYVLVLYRIIMNTDCPNVKNNWPFVTDITFLWEVHNSPNVFHIAPSTKLEWKNQKNHSPDEINPFKGSPKLKWPTSQASDLYIMDLSCVGRCRLL